MKLDDQKLDSIGKVLLVIFAFVLLLFSIESRAQSYIITKCTEDEVYKKHPNDMFIKGCSYEKPYMIFFNDEFSEIYYINGKKVTPTGMQSKLEFTEKEYKQLIKDIKKSFKYTEYEVDRSNYSVINYSWVKDSVWVYYNKKAFSLIKNDIEYFEEVLEW
tara:strand:- start:575 stop:1054 length:480 start_codon:yes stop_codon:yes gene_type:complete